MLLPRHKIEETITVDILLFCINNLKNIANVKQFNGICNNVYNQLWEYELEYEAVQLLFFTLVAVTNKFPEYDGDHKYPLGGKQLYIEHANNGTLWEGVELQKRLLLIDRLIEELNVYRYRHRFSKWIQNKYPFSPKRYYEHF